MGDAVPIPSRRTDRLPPSGKLFKLDRISIVERFAERAVDPALATAFAGSYRSTMAVGVVRLGSPRTPREGLRLGTVRRPPRGVAKKDFARLDYYDLWLPDLAPSAPLVAFALSQPFTSTRWAVYSRRYRREMAEPAIRRLIAVLAAMSRQTDFTVGCYCADESHCHRSLLRQLFVEAGAAVV